MTVVLHPFNYPAPKKGIREFCSMHRFFEAEINDRCHVVILITADTDVRIDRVCNRDNTTPDEVEDRIMNQMSDDEKKIFGFRCGEQW